MPIFDEVEQIIGLLEKHFHIATDNLSLEFDGTELRRFLYCEMILKDKLISKAFLVDMNSLKSLLN